MPHIKEIRVRPELKELVVEASRALARLDAERLEELALSCRALKGATPEDVCAHSARADEAWEAAREIAVFARVMEATRANREMICRLRELSAGRQEYGPRRGQIWTFTENGHGDN
jgi:hypothetical protein